MIEARWNKERLLNFRKKSQKQIPLLVGWAPGWGEPHINNVLPGKPTPRSNIWLLAPAQFSVHIPSFGWVDPGGPGLGWAPKNKILPGKPNPRSNLILLTLAQFLTLQGFSDRVIMSGTPRGQNFGLTPGLVSSPGEMRSPCQNLAWWLGWIRQPAARTHTLLLNWTF